MDIRTEQRKLYFELLQGAKDRVEKGAQRNCFIDNMFKEEAGGAKNALDDEHIAYVGGADGTRIGYYCFDFAVVFDGYGEVSSGVAESTAGCGQGLQDGEVTSL